MFIIEWVYAVANIVVALLLFLYIGKASPGLPLGEFHSPHFKAGPREQMFWALAPLVFRLLSVFSLGRLAAVARISRIAGRDTQHLGIEPRDTDSHS